MSSPQPQPLQSMVLLVCEPCRGVTCHHVLCRWSLDTVLLCRNRQERRCNPPFSPRLHPNQHSSMGIANHAKAMVPAGWPSDGRDFLTSRMRESCELLLLASSLKSRWLRVLRKERNSSSRALTTAGAPRGLDSNQMHLGWRRSLASSRCSLGESMPRSLQQIFRNF